MATRPIVFLGEPVLRQKALKVKQIDKSIEKLIDDMVDTLHSANGLGLAANQVGVRQRVVIVELPADEEDPGSGKLYALINPEITASSQDLMESEEGCLSIPYYYGEVVRPNSVVVKARDRKWREVKIKATGLLARALQHEIDHLNGVLFVDRMDGMAKLRYVPGKSEAEIETESYRDAEARRVIGSDLGNQQQTGAARELQPVAG
jgi:peptide deformylase